MGTGKIFTGLAALLFVVTLCSVSFAQENRVLMTTDQQYQNLVKNADFESWVNWTTNNTNPPDAWAKVAAPTILQETSTAKIGATSLKITAVTTGDGISQDVAVEKNTTYTVTFYYKVDSTFSCTFSLAGNVTTFSLTGASGLNSTTWTRKEFTITTANDTTLTVKMVADNASNVFYLDGVSVTKGAATPAFSRAVLNDSGSQTLYGNLTVNGTTNLSGDVNLGSLSTHNITLTGTLKSPAATAVSVQSANGILELKTASKNNELRVWDSTGAKYTSLLNQDLTTYSGDLTINPASGITNITGALTVSTTVTATGNLSAAMLSSDGTNFYDFGNNTGNVPVSNGTLNTNLNAEKLGGLTQSTSGSNAHVLATDASGNISVVNDNASGTVTAATAFITGTNPALTGQIRIPNNTWINARNAANGADINLISLDTSNRVNFGTTPVAAFTAAGTITGSSSPIITGFGTINGATLSGGTLSGGSLSGGAYTGVDLTPTTLTLGNGIVYTLNPAINVSSPGATGS